MRNKIIVVLMMLCFSLGTWNMPQVEAADLNGVTVRGTSEMEVEPDMATLGLRIKVQGRTTAEAGEQLDREIANVKEIMRGVKIPLLDLKMSQYSLDPVYEYTSGKPKLLHQEGVAGVQIKVDDLSKLASLIGSLRNLGNASNELSLGNINYDLKDKMKLESRLLTDAVKDAENRAKIVAQAGGRVLGPMIKANVNYGGMNMRLMSKSTNTYDSARGEGIPQLFGGTIKLSVQVETVFALRPMRF